MSDTKTPRTDAAKKYKIQVYPHQNGEIETVHVDLAMGLETELAETRKERDAVYQTNAKQAAKINEIQGYRDAFYQRLATAFGLDPAADENPSIVELINQTLRDRDAALARAKKAEGNIALMERFIPDALNNAEKYQRMESDIASLRAQLADLRTLLVTIQFDYDHPWPNEDDGTRIHRETMLSRITSTIDQAQAHE